MFRGGLIGFFFVYFFGAFQVEVYSDDDIQGYYWRDYTGLVPEDALLGGVDVTGKPIYIGQIYDRYLIPAKIYSTDSKKAYYEYGGQENVVTENIKILCSPHLEQFEWIKTNNEDIKLLTEKNLILGGYEPGCTTYIGRVRAGGEISIGKVLTDNDPINSGLHITKGERGERHTSFEVLAFNNIKTPGTNVDGKVVVRQLVPKCEKRPVTIKLYC